MSVPVNCFKYRPLQSSNLQISENQNQYPVAKSQTGQGLISSYLALIGVTVDGARWRWRQDQGDSNLHRDPPRSNKTPAHPRQDNGILAKCVAVARTTDEIYYSLNFTL